jgi:uncharacterized protein (TIGR03118 family)
MAMGVIGRRAGTPALALAAVVLLLAAVQLARPLPAAADDETAVVQTNLVSDLAGVAKVQDPNLKNPWGITHSATSPWWVSDNNAGVATLYTGAGAPVPLVVTIPAPGASSGGTPTGVVFNGKAGDFVVTDGRTSGTSAFIFATEDGTIAGWSPAVNRTQAFIAVDNSAVPDAADGAVYKGLAIAQTISGQRLFAANFRAGTVDVFDSAFQPVHTPGRFRDRAIPDGFAPFGIQQLGGRIYVSYAKQDADRHDDVKGPGNGFVDVYSTEGRLLKRLIRHGALNSPWGMVLAPPGFADGALLVGNFGDGRINAYDREGEFEGPLRRPDGSPVVIDGLWGLGFGNDAAAGPSTTLFFAAGINDEQDGLFGTLTATGEGDR